MILQVLTKTEIREKSYGSGGKNFVIGLCVSAQNKTVAFKDRDTLTAFANAALDLGCGPNVNRLLYKNAVLIDGNKENGEPVQIKLEHIKLPSSISKDITNGRHYPGENFADKIIEKKTWVFPKWIHSTYDDCFWRRYCAYASYLDNYNMLIHYSAKNGNILANAAEDAMRKTVKNKANYWNENLAMFVRNSVDKWHGKIVEIYGNVLERISVANALRLVFKQYKLEDEIADHYLGKGSNSHGRSSSSVDVSFPDIYPNAFSEPERNIIGWIGRKITGLP